MISRRLHNWTRIVLTMFLGLPLFAAAQSTGMAVEPLFSSHEVLNIRIEAPISRLMQERPEDEYLEGTLSYTDPTGAAHDLDLKIQTRGEYRRQKRTCLFAPIRLNLRKKQVAGTIFAGQDKLKLISHCKTGSNRYEQLVLKEYLAYRSLQVLTDMSFRARLLRITYVDNDDDNKTITRFGFVIEDEKRVADRIRLSQVKTPKIDYANLERQRATLVDVFQYMIGNTDYSMIRGALNDNCCHNIKLFRDNNGQYIPIPYDFDFAGMVNAPYATPNPKLRINSVRVHYYRGRCNNNELLEDTAAYIRGHEMEILDLVENLDGLEDGHRRNVVRYLNVFFERASTPRKIERYLAKKCS